jgi:hypothetical protein
MATRTNRRQAPARQAVEELAVLRTQMDNLTEQMGKVLHYLEGNGRPGLLQRVPELERALSEHEARAENRLAKIEQALDRSTSIQTGTQRQLDEMTARFNTHTDPSNLGHRTIAQAWATNPKGLLKNLGLTALVVYILVEAGVLRAVVEWLARLS